MGGRCKVQGEIRTTPWKDRMDELKHEGMKNHKQSRR